jgi:hypothetical protein
VKKAGSADSNIEATKVSADNEAKCMMITAQANAESSEQFANALLTGAKAERENASKVQDLREFKEQIGRA